MWALKCSILLDPINQGKVKKAKESLFSWRIWIIPSAHNQWLPNGSKHEKKTPNILRQLQRCLCFLSLPRTVPGSQISYMWEPIFEGELQQNISAAWCAAWIHSETKLLAAVITSDFNICIKAALPLRGEKNSTSAYLNSGRNTFEKDGCAVQKLGKGP